MFYLFFALSLAIVIFAAWLIYELYKILSYKHHAETHYGKIIKRLKEKQELLPDVINTFACRDEGERDILARIRLMRNEAEKEKDVVLRLAKEEKLDRMIDRLKAKLAHGINDVPTNISGRMEEAKKAVHDAVRDYNDMARRTGEIYDKKAVGFIAKAFRIHPLRLIPTFNPENATGFSGMQDERI